MNDIFTSSVTHERSHVYYNCSSIKVTFSFFRIYVIGEEIVNSEHEVQNCLLGCTAV
jgi:hypothetical protein